MRDDERVIEDGESPGTMPGDDTADDDLVEPYGEHADEIDFEDDDELVDGGEVEVSTEAEAQPTEAESANQPKFVAPVFNNFMDVLYPANPPAAKNARIVRRFDLEAAKYDPRPTAAAPAPAPTPAAAPAPAPVPEKKEPALTREELRALRNRSLRAAAGLG